MRNGYKNKDFWGFMSGMNMTEQQKQWQFT
jgi:hypothetical protein